MVYRTVKTYKKGFLPVGDGHKMYYECSGNKNGKPVVFIHGGPGGGFSDKDKQYFNPRYYNMIHFDQRGCGRSKPFASLKANTTDHLIKDIVKLLDHLKIDKAIIFGGSWGSTLSLVFAIRHPERVKALFVRGIFLASKEDNKFFEEDIRNFYPEVWDTMMSLVPPKERKNLAKFYFKKLKSKDKKVQLKYARAWATYELSSSRLHYNPKKIHRIVHERNPLAFARIELHYLTQNCFLPKDYILKNAHKITMKTFIVHGRYDMVCRPSNAFDLHQALPNSKLYITFGGHSSGDPDTLQRTVQVMDGLAKR